MARKRKQADMTYAQKVAAANDQFRAEALAQALEDTAAAEKPGRDDGTFKRDTYKAALKDAKASA